MRGRDRLRQILCIRYGCLRFDSVRVRRLTAMPADALYGAVNVFGAPMPNGPPSTSGNLLFEAA